MKRTTGWYGKQRITNGHRNYNGTDIKTTKCKKSRECWVKSPANVPSEAAKDIKEALMTPGQNYGKDNYTIDLTGAEATYWLGTESGLLGVFQIDGTCTAGDGSCDVRSLSNNKSLNGSGLLQPRLIKMVNGEATYTHTLPGTKIETVT